MDVIEENNLAVIDKAFREAPATYQPLKNRSLANLYQYLAYLHLTYTPDREGGKRAGRCLRKAIGLHRALLFTGKMQRTLLWWLLARLPPAPAVAYIISLHSKLRLRCDSRLRALRDCAALVIDAAYSPAKAAASGDE